LGQKPGKQIGMERVDSEVTIIYRGTAHLSYIFRYAGG